MRVILSREEYDALWEEAAERFNYPNARERSFNVKAPYKWKTFKLPPVPWDDKQEILVNKIFKSLEDNELYALDWQHDCFVYNPNENIPPDTFWEDKERNCRVYFPTYYPNGDWYAFTSMDFKYGLCGHPWNKEIYVVGADLIEKFENCKEKLKIV